MAIKPETLVKVAKELNKKLVPETPISTDVEDVEGIKKGIKRVIPLIEEGETFSPITQKVIEAFSKKKVEEAPQEEAEEEKPKAKKNAEVVNLAEEKEKKKAKKNKQPKEARYTKVMALREALNKPGTLMELVKRTQEVFEQKTGEKAGEATKATLAVHLPALIHFGAVKLEGGVYSLVK